MAAYFDAILSPGRPPVFPADRWSRSESTESFNRFFGDGATLGYGVSVAGLEVTGQPQRPLFVRWVEALSPAAAAGVQRGCLLYTSHSANCSTICWSTGVSPTIRSSASSTAKGWSPTRRCPHSTAWPRPSAWAWRT